MSDFYKHLDAIRKIADETFQPAEAKAKPDFLDLDKDGDKTEPMKSAAKAKEVKENPETDYEGSMDYEFTGDDGEMAYGTLHYKAVNGVVDPKSLRGESEYEGNAKVDDEFATQMVQPGGADHEQALIDAQDDYDYEAQRMRSKFGESNEDSYEYDWACEKCGAENRFVMTPQEADEYIKNWEEDNEDLVADGETGQAALDNLIYDAGAESNLHHGEKCIKCGTIAESTQKESDEDNIAEYDGPDETQIDDKSDMMKKLKDLKDKYNAQMAGQYPGDPDDTEAQIEKIEKELGMSQESINTEAMKKDINEAITMTAETPEEASVLMQILKLAGVTPVSQDMINQPEAEKSQEEPCGSQTAGDQMRATMDKISGEEPTEEFANEPNVDYQNTNDLVNTHSGGLNRQKVQVKKGYPGDNDMVEANELETLANRLREQYNTLYKKVEESDLNTKEIEEKVQSPYAVGMAQAMKSTGDKPPLEKSTIKKAHDIAKAVAKND
jgi:hypothetical protein